LLGKNSREEHIGATHIPWLLRPIVTVLLMRTLNRRAPFAETPSSIMGVSSGQDLTALTVWPTKKRDGACTRKSPKAIEIGGLAGNDSMVRSNLLTNLAPHDDRAKNHGRAQTHNLWLQFRGCGSCRGQETDPEVQDVNVGPA